MNISPTIQNAYDKLKAEFKGSNLAILKAEENNELCKKGILPIEDLLEGDLNGLIIADAYYEPTFNERKATLNGAYWVEEHNNDIKAIWLPYPEEPIIGLDNFIQQLKNQSF